MIDRLGKVLGLLLLGLILVVLGFVMDKINLRTFSFLIFFGTGSFLFFAPLSWAIHLLVLYVGIEGFAKLMTNYNPIIHVGADILIVCLWARVIFTHLLYRKPLPTNYPPLTGLFLLHVIWFVITIANPHALSVVASLAGAKLYITIVSLYFFGFYLTRDAKSVRAFMIPWVLILGIQVVTSMYQASIGPSSVTSLSPAYSIALQKYGVFAFRPFGLTSQPGMPCVFIYITIPFVLYFLVYSRSILISLILLPALPGSFVTLLVCQVRSALLKGLLESFIFTAFTFKELSSVSRRLRIYIIPIIIFTTLSITFIMPIFLSRILTGNKDNQRAIERSLTLFDYARVSTARHGALDRFMEYAQSFPLGAGLSRIGAAAGHFQYLIEAENLGRGFFSDNLWVEMVVDLGLPGVLIISSILFLTLGRGLFSLLRIRDPELRILQWTILSSLSAILLGAYGAEPILYNPEGPFFWFFAGVITRIPQLDRENA